MYAELEILLLRPQPPGMLVSEHGDIDNRIKTLFDALRVPTKSEAQTLAEKGLLTNEQTFCLLEDDRLVTKLSVNTDRWLGQSSNSKKSLAIIQVSIKASRVTLGNLSVVA